MRRRIHVSNLFASTPTLELAARLTASGPFAACFFGNSGTEANEAAIKFARLYAHRTRGAGHHQIVSFTSGFHGRTMGALSTTHKAAYREPFEPLIGGVRYLPFNDVAALDELDERTAGVIVEPIQGEGGLSVVSQEFASALNEKCRERDIILIADEVQSGMGRTGRLYGSNAVGLAPDIVTLSKPLAAGLPLSATLIPERVNDLLSPGDHGSTFGGNPVACAVAIRVWDELTRAGFIERVSAAGELIAEQLKRIASRSAILGSPRGLGLLRGIPVEIDGEPAPDLLGKIMEQARTDGLLILRSGVNMIHLAPPLNIRDRELKEGLARLERAVQHVESDYQKEKETV
jgi:acetylornithine/N-succinyldiaminopimelate aminotransferase